MRGACGRSTGVSGGTGGGAIELTVGGALTVDGMISARGTNGAIKNNYDGGGGGSGGSVYLTAGTLAGAGTITADGGSGGNTYRDGGGGSGGRVALYYDSDTFGGTVTAHGEWGYGYGGSGTIYRKPSGQAEPDLLVDNNGQAGPVTTIDTGLIFRDVTVTGSGHLYVGAGVELTASGILNDLLALARG